MTSPFSIRLAYVALSSSTSLLVHFVLFVLTPFTLPLSCTCTSPHPDVYLTWEINNVIFGVHLKLYMYI